MTSRNFSISFGIANQIGGLDTAVFVVIALVTEYGGCGWISPVTTIDGGCQQRLGARYRQEFLPTLSRSLRCRGDPVAAPIFMEFLSWLRRPSDALRRTSRRRRQRRDCGWTVR